MELAMSEVRDRFSEIVEYVQNNGGSVIILRDGRPAARLTAVPMAAKLWRVSTPDNPAAYAGVDLDAPILEEI